MQKVIRRLKVSHWYTSTLHSPFGLQCITLSVLMGFLMSFQPALFSGERFFMGEIFDQYSTFLPLAEEGFIRNDVGVDTSGLEQVEITDEEGNVVRKIVPRKRDRKVLYRVKHGDTISRIAHKFGLKVSTILWANRLNSKQTIRVGQELTIPPADGIYYTVQAQDTLGDIAKAHSIDIAKIRAYNRINRDLIKPGQSLFLPEAKKVFIAPRTFTTTRYSTKTSLPSLGGFRIIRPSKGVLTQGYHRGHYALDIANKLNTPIYAAAGGKVIKVANDGWNYGYGRYIVIDHGNSIETLYGHNNINKVRVGQTVKPGQLIALMGNTGRVFGPTGIHLHFELRIKGRKVNPNGYFQ